MRYQLAPQRYESSPGGKHVVHEQDALSPEPFGVELQIGGAVSVPARALVLRPVISDGYRPVPVGNPHVRRELAAERLVPGAVLLPCGCRDGNQYGTVPVLLNRPDTAAGIKPVHEARQVPALVQAHADGQAAVEVGLADDVPAAPGEMLLVAGTGLQKEIELAVVLETDDVLATQAACNLAQDAALLLDDRRSGKEGVLCDKDSLVHSDDVWSVTNMRNVRHTASGKGGKYAEGRADM